MKRRIFFLILLLIGMATTGYAQLINEGFEGVTFPPTGWTVTSFTQSSVLAHTGTYSARGSTATTAYLNSPLLTTPGTLTFWHIRTGSNGANSFHPEYATQAAPTTWVAIGGSVAAGTAWTQQTIDLSALTNIYFRIRWNHTSILYIDDFVVTSIATPTIALTGSLVDFGSVKVGTNSTEQTYSVSATNLTGNLVLTAPTGFGISTTTGAGFGGTVTLTPTAGTINSTTIYVRFSPGVTGVLSGNITHVSSGATTQNRAVSGTGINNPVITTPTSASITSTTAILGGNITSINLSNVTERGVYYSTTNGFVDGTGTKVSETAGAPYGTGIFTMNVSGLTAGTTYYYKAFATNAAGTSYTTQGTFSTPIVSISSSMVDFGSVKVGNSSAEQEYTVSGAFLTANLIITAPIGFQISTTSGAGFGSSVTLIPAAGTVNLTTIYVRFTPVGTGVSSGDITNASTGATTQTIAVSGTGINNPVIGTPTSASITSISAVLGGNITAINSSTVTERGIYYSTTNGFADGAGTKVSEFGSFGTGIFTVNVSGLTKGTTYYFKAFATNAAGTSYTGQATFGTPGITLTGALVNFGLVKVGANSAEQTYSVAAVNLTDNLVVTAPTGYQVSKTTAAGFGSSISFTPAAGTVATSTVFVRFAPTGTGVIAGNITHTSAATTTEERAVTGTGMNNPTVVNPTSASITSVSAVLGGEVTNTNFSTVTERGIYYSTTNGFADGAGTKVSEVGSYSTGLFTLNVTGLAQAVTYYFKAFATNAAGTSYTTQASFLTPAVFTPANITVTQANPASGTVVIGSVITVTVTDNLNQTPSAFQVVTANLSEFGGPVALPMVKTTNLPLNGIYTATYTVLPGDIDANGRTVSVTVSNYNTVEDEAEFVVKNYLDIPDILTSYLRVNNDPLDTTMKIGDTIHLIMTLKSYVDSVWVNWGSAFTDAPTIAYKVIGGSLNASFTPVAGQLIYTANLTIQISKMRSTNGYFTYADRVMLPFEKLVSFTAGGVPIIADLVEPDINSSVDLFYDTNKPLRFSPIIAGIDGYTTIPNTFAIRFYIPEWGGTGETNKITIKFESETRSTFYRTFTGAEVTTETSGTRDLPVYQQIIWDGKDNLGNYVSPGVSTTYGLTIWALMDEVDNNTVLIHDLGPEYSPTGVHDDATHYIITDGETILNRIHVVVDNLNPIYNTNLTIPAATPTHDDTHLIRYINDTDYDAAYDPGESIQYTDITSPTTPNGNSTVDMSFRVQREYTVDSNPLRHESVKGWVVLEQTGTANKWYFNGANWIVLNPADLTFQYTDVASVPFPAAATYSNVVNVSWDTSNLLTFPGSDPGITYKLYAYIQDNAGNITKSVEKSVIVENRYIQLPVITNIALTSQHVPGPGGVLPAETGGVNNYYLTSAYTALDLPYTGNYYVSPDIMNVKFTVNDPDLLRPMTSVLVDFPDGFGIADFYINKADFNAAHEYTKSITVGNIAASAGSTAGTLWTLSENPVAAGSIQVRTWSTIIIGGNSIEGDVLDTETFRLLIPAKPDFPTTNVNDYHLTATPPILSPGNPLFTYDAFTNPANDNLIDESNFSFVVPERSTPIHWTLKLETQDASPVIFKTWSGDLPVSLVEDVMTGYNFTGLKDDFTLGVPILATQSLNLKLIIQPSGYADPGYLPPPANITPTTVVKVDNTNPAMISGTGTTINAVTNAITLDSGTPIVTETENLMTFTLYTSEPLPAVISSTDGLGWQVEVRDSLGAILMNGGNRVNAIINSILPGNGNSTTGYQTFAFTVAITNLPGDFTALKSVLVVKSPWDAASNPGRYNNPVYPYNADVYNNDSNEAYLTFNILNAKPRITQIDFTHRSVTGTAKLTGENWNPQFAQGWVNSGTPNTFTMTATVTGGVYRALVSNFAADLSAFMGPTYNAVLPDQVTAPAGSPNEARIWTLTWTNKAINSTLATAWVDNQVLNIPIRIVTQDGALPAVHSEQRDINIKVDKVNPTISSSAVSLTADGTPQSFVFSIADPTPGSGINWTTASLGLSPSTGITIGGGSNGTWPVTIPANSSHKYLDATVTVSDYMGNSFTYHRYVNVIPVPAISAVSLTTVNTGEVSNNYFVPGRVLRTNFTITNPQRVKRLVITLTASGGVTILNNVQTLTSGFDVGYVLFNGVTSAVPTDLDGKIITATVTGVTDAYIAPTAAATQEINLTGNNSTATINVDTKPVVTGVVFKYNGQVTNTLLKNMTNVSIEVTVSHVSALNTTTNPISITMAGVTGTFNPGTPTPSAISGGTKYVWNNVSFANLNWTPASDYKVADFTVNCRTIYGYLADPRIHQMAVISDRSNQIYGVLPSRDAYAGIDPDGWFAPEHLLKVDYTFISTVDQTLPPIKANFDQIEDNLQDNWTNPSALSTKTPIVITLTQGGTPITFTVYKYLAKWSVQPDVQSVWNAYEDGAAAPVYFKYIQYSYIGEIDDNRSIQVDKKVPIYDTAQLWVAVKSTTPVSGDYQFINNGFNRPTTLALQTNGSWVTGNNIYVKYRAKDSTTGIGVTEIYNPANPIGWTVSEPVAQTDLGAGVVEKVVRLTPTNPASISASTLMSFMLAKVEDKVGHVNYGLPVNSTDPNWVSTGPVLNFNFSANYVTNLQNLEAFQVFGGNYTDNKSKPYVKAGQPLGVILKLAPLARGVDVQSITVSNVKINTKWITSVGGTTADNFVTLAYNAPGDYYYLNSSYLVNSAYAHGAGITLQYQINYTITYTDATTSSQQFNSQAIPNMATVENNSPVLKDVWVWSGSLGPAQEGYVVPNDSDGTVKIIFEEQAGYVNPTTKPSVSITNLNVFVTGVSSPYTVPAAALTYYSNYSLTIRGVAKNYTNVWVADLVNLPIKVPSPVTTSTEIGYTIADVVGNSTISGDRFVEIAANGPIVPIIRYAELLTALPEGQVVTNYMAQTVPAQLKVYIDVELPAYIEDAWATPIPGITFGTFSPAVSTTLHNSKYVVTIPVIPDNINNISANDSIMITLNTKRNPFGGQVFFDAETIGVRVDGELFNLISPAVISNSVYGNIPGMVNPAVQTTVTAQINDIGELIGLRGLATLPTNQALAGWFTLQNNDPVAFTNIPTPVVTGTGNGRTVTWVMQPTDINPDMVSDAAPMSVKIQYRDIYGLIKTYDNINFNVDKTPPVLAANGIIFYDTHTTPEPSVLQQNDYNAAGWITNSLDWDKVRFVFEDPIIRAGVNGAGVNSAIVTLTKENETYPTAALNNVIPVVVDANTIELKFNNGFSANELAEGYYNFNISVVDNIENDIAYTQRFWYGFAPATLLIQPGNNASLDVSDVQQQVSAITGDPQGQINGVDFHLYYDANDDGIYQAGTDPDYTADITADDGNPDWVAPFDVMWNLTNRSHYAYLVDPEYGTNATRRFLLRASIISQNRSVTDSIVVINVTDDQPAVPEIPWYNGNTTFDYLNTANNVLTFTTRFIDWPDARRVRFEISKVGDPTVIDTIGTELAYPTDNASVQWNFSDRTPGDYIVKVYGRDVVGNWSPAVSMTAPITIYDPASIVTYGMTMRDIQGYNITEEIIPSGTIYGFNHQASTIGDLRLDVRFDSLNVHSGNSFNYLSGVSAITFKAVVRNNITGTETTVEVPNNTALQPDYPAIGSIPVTPQIMNVPVRIFVPDSFFMPAGYDSNDFTYKFFIELTPTHPSVLQSPVYSNLRFDYFAPRVVITSNSPYITWSKSNQFMLQDEINDVLMNDISDIDHISLLWSMDNGTTWHDALATQVNDPNYIRFDNWITRGGSVNTLLYNYEGNVSLKVRAYDDLDNMRESAVITSYVDNKAPIVPISQVAYSTVDQNQIVQNPYTVLHTLGTLPNESGNTITAVASSGTYGTSVLQLRTNQIDISGLSTTAIGPTYGSWYSYPDAPWYTGNNDLRPPIILYHGYSPTGDDTEIQWTPGELYDHEADINGNYGFDINFKAWAQMYNMPIAGTHYFIFAAKDSRGNMEGDFADTLGVYYDGVLSNMEKANAIDLIVNVINVSDVEGQIVSHNDNQIVSEWINLAADITGNAYNVDVDQVRFERKQGENWLPIATINRAGDGEARPVMFHLYRSDIPQFDGLPYVPGVHLYADGYFVRELTWNQSDGAWADTVSFQQGNHNFEYRLDLNNDGVIDGLDSNIANVLGVSYIVSDPNGFTNFNVTPWITYLDTRTIPIGLYEFRALPLTATGDVLFNKVAPSRWLVVDNIAPSTTITVVGGITRIQPNVPFGLVSDVNELLVAQDDIVDVTYQYASQPQLTVWLNNTSFRRWNNISTSFNMAGNYAITWAAPTTDNDMIDNDNDGLIDEIDEQDAIYYLRAIAKDKAGNYFTSNIYEIEVDGSAPTMIVNALNGVEMSSTNNIFEIPADGTITVSALNNTPNYFDNPVTTRFMYMYKASQSANWSGWQLINGWVPVVNGVASVELPLPTDGYLEGYYGFKTISKDALGNTDASPAITYVVFNDVTGSNVHITRVGNRDIVSDAYGFAQEIEDYQGNIIAILDNPLDVNTATFEYALSSNGPWTNINTMVINGQSTISTAWTIPVNLRAPFIYLRVVAQDINGNNQSSQTVKLYIDTTSPGLTINSVTHTVVNNQKVLDPENSVWINISFTDLPDVGVVDVSHLDLRLIGPDNSVTFIENYQNVGQASVDFEITTTQLEGLSDGIYRLAALLTDFAGNSTGVETPIVPYGYDALYIDTTPPVNLNLYSTTHPNWQAPYNSSITFRIDYTDLIGIPPTDAMTAAFSYMDANDTVSTYTVNESDGYIEFVWDPSAAFEQYLIDGLENIAVSAEISVKDFLNFEAFVPNTDEFFELTYGIPTNARMMAVSDVVNDERVIHFVNWNLANPQIVEQLGTNHTAGQNAAPLKMYAYVPHQAEIPTNMEFYYRRQGTTTWNEIGSNEAGDQWNFVDPSFNDMFQRQYSIDWNIVDLVGGVYEVKTVSTYLAGESESIILVDIYNSNLIPLPVVNNMLNGNVERGNTYTIGVQSYTGTASYVEKIRYQYRYVDNTGNVITPLSQWSYFGELDGTEISNWISAPYNFDWTVYPYYLYNNDIQIVGYAKDKWGTETQISPIIQNGSYVIAHISDSIAPEIRDITVNWNGIQNPGWLSGVMNPAATVKAHIVSNVNPNDIVRVEFYYNDTLIQTESGYPVNSQVTDFWTLEYDFEIPSTGNPVDIITVKTYDIYNNMSVLTKQLNIDNAYPTANLTLTQGGIPITDLEREAEVTLNANASDVPSGVSTVGYYYQMAGASEWILISTVESAPFTTDWTVPADLEFGAQYAFKAVVTDNVGLILNAIPDESYEVIDQDTEISIVSVAGHTPVNQIIPFRLHGNFDVVTDVTEGQNVPRLEFLIRSITSTDWRIIESPYLTEIYDYSANFNLNSLDSGNYYLGVAPHGRWVASPVDSVMVTLDNVLNITGITSTPTSDGYFNGTQFVVNFTVATDDEINEDQVHLQYSYPIAPDNWYSFDVEPELLTLDGNTYQATFSDINIYHVQNIMDGYYNFRINVVDAAIPEPNAFNAIVATNVLFDTGAPSVIFSSINGETDMAQPISIELGSNTIINAAAFDILGGQIHLIASGIQKVEFYSQRGLGPRILIATDTTEPYGIIWNTLGYQLGDYTLTAVAYDNAGNQGEYSKLVSIVSPGVLQPYAVITAMNFDANTANQDNIYAVTHSWAGVDVTGVAFEYYNGTSWLEFAEADLQNGYWKASFNAELMTSIQKVRAVTTYSDDMVSTIKPELVVSYSPLNGGSFITSPAIQSAIYFEDKLNIFEVSNTPIVTTIYDGSFVEMPLVQIVNGDYEAGFNVNAHGLYTFWSSSLDNLGNVQLVKSELQTTNVGTAVSVDNVISVPVPANSYVYFENVKNPIPLTEGFRAISSQKAAIANNSYPGGGYRDMMISITMTLNAVVNEQGTIVGMYYDGNEWVTCPAIYNATNNTVTFEAMSGHIYAIAQYSDIIIEAQFADTTPQYIDAATNVWTQDDSQIRFFVYDGINEGGYESPALEEITYSMYLDSLQVAATYANGFITYTAEDLAAGAHLVRVVVNKNDFTAVAQRTIYVDVTRPVIVPIPGQISSTNRIISANISDLETGILDVTLSINPAEGEGYYSALTIPIESMTVIGNIYSYELSLDEIYNLGYQCNSTQTMTVAWETENNLEMCTSEGPIFYTVNIEGPSIVFTGFENGWWLNPTNSTPLTFNVIAAPGRTIPSDGVEVAVYEVTPLSSNGDDIQYMTLAPISVVGNVYSYSLNFGQMLSPEATAVLLEVHARDNYDVDNESEQTYGIDYAPPVVYAMSPVGDPIDNDGDGLFNEDPIDGINQDQDWDDWDHDGLWDDGVHHFSDNGDIEPPIIDEDPIDFYADSLQYGTNVVVSFAYYDYQGYHYFPSNQDWYYTGASGINTNSVSATLNGVPMTGIITNGTFTYAAGILNSGHYTVVASVADNTGNVGGLSFTFDIYGGAPTVTFIEPAGGWWLNSNNNNELSFTVQSQSQLAEDGVVANVFTIPSNTLIQGPMTLAPADGEYSVQLLGGLIPNDQIGVRLEVVASNVWGYNSTSNQSYGIDNVAPQIDIQSPLANSVVTINSIVNIAAVISDQTVSGKSTNPMFNTVKSSQRGDGRPSGSGITNVTLSVIDPGGNNVINEVYPANTQIIAEYLTAASYGTYHVNVKAIDGAGNQSMASVSFLVPAPAPEISFMPFEGSGWNYSLVNNEPFHFEINATGNIPVSNVTATFFAMPENTIIQGPHTVAVTENGMYNVTLGNSITPQTTGVRLEVTAMNNLGGSITNSQIYSVDRDLPVITFQYPENESQITLVDENTKINIRAVYTDIAMGKNAKQGRANGSGIASALLVVLNPDNEIVLQKTTGVDTTEVNASVDNLMLGVYTIRLSVWDKAGNKAVATVTCEVINAPTPPEALTITDAHIYPNPMSDGSRATFVITLNTSANLSVKVYDFAGREVRDLNYYYVVNAKTPVEISWDGRNAKGDKLARGPYFARVIANDGKKIVEKVVKVAITK